MATFVIVHGGFGGGWEWTPVADALRARGHRAFTPTLSGMGERHRLGPGTTLTDQIADVSAVLEFEDLRDVVLCGASFGGMVVTGVADRMPGRVRLVVYIDALVPEDGQAAVDLLPEAAREAIASAAGDDGHGWVEVVEEAYPPEGLISEQRRDAFVSRLRPQPAATFTEKLRLSGAIERLPKAFVRCTGGQLSESGDPIEPAAARARGEGWIYRELHAPHDPHLFEPAATIDVLLELAT